MKKLSIIVPVYNTQNYISKCLDSLVQQTLEDIEIIVVNDGSPDNSEQIIKEYEKSYPNIIKYIKKENGGLSDARNAGIAASEGEYIGFVDSDDYVEKDMFKLMYEKAKSKDFDLVTSNVLLVYENSNKENEEVSSAILQDIFDIEKIKEVMTYIYPVACNKIYKRKFFDEVKFKNNIWFEDVEFMLRLFPYIKSIGIVNKPLYNYLQRSDSITYTFNGKLYDFINNMEGIIDYYKANNFYDEYKEELEYLYVRYAFATFMKRLAKTKSIKKYIEGYKYAKMKVDEKYPDYKKNKYLKQRGLKGYYLKFFNIFLATLNYIYNKNKKYN